MNNIDSYTFNLQFAMMLWKLLWHQHTDPGTIGENTSFPKCFWKSMIHGIWVVQNLIQSIHFSHQAFSNLGKLNYILHVQTLMWPAWTLTLSFRTSTPMTPSCHRGSYLQIYVFRPSRRAIPFPWSSTSGWQRSILVREMLSRFCHSLI